MTTDHDPWPHRLALLVTAATFPLIFMGGLVTTKGAGMSVPDWPNSYGYNMVLFPPSQWIGGIWYEHVHRLLGTLVGFLAVTLCLYVYAPARKAGGRKALGRSTLLFFFAAVGCGGVMAWHRARGDYAGLTADPMQHYLVGFASLALVAGVGWLCRRREDRRWVRRLTIANLLAVIAQGVIGGLRVRNIDTDLAIIHGCFAQAFLCLSALIVVVTTRRWKSAKTRVTHAGGWTVTKLAGLCVVLLYGQLVVGALMRHYKAGLAIPTLPLAFGRVLPPTNDVQLHAANLARAVDYHLTPVSMTGMWLHYGHRVGALVVTAALIGLAAAVWRTRSIGRGLVLLILGFVFTQFTLGVLTVYDLKPADIASLHVACGALLLMSTFVLTCVLARVYAPVFRTANSTVASRSFPVIVTPQPAAS